MSASADIEQMRDLHNEVIEDYAPPNRPLRVYIAGPMGGLPGYNYDAFHEAAQMIRSVGCEAINPAEADLFFGPPGNVPRETYLRHAMTNVGICDAIYLLPGWQKSGGALLELHLAVELGMLVVTSIEPDLNLLRISPSIYRFTLEQTGPGEVMTRGEETPILDRFARIGMGLVARIRERLAL